ncbi:sulfotransferase domain-containing protein [Salegentibacter flavus]|uniref:Sulfotransferase domain-containing protein n=1 Tax=Salegentibacter flavus TaxID=287099 RepID=A0A1I5CVC3_9FLAO|nr:sulfotransferase domain-containing protein [Salegentibacter flavus]SFN90914.1 Sulfotransferase domain-containing protein [Salegentibacter flavus]
MRTDKKYLSDTFPELTIAPMKNKFDCLVIASQYSGAREVFDLLKQNIITGTAPEIHQNKAILECKSAKEGENLRIGIFEFESLEELCKTDISEYLLLQAKIYLMLRNPVWRSFASYRKNREEGKERSSFIEAVKWDSSPPEVGLGPQNTRYIIAGKYSEGIRSLLKQTDEHELQILEYEELRRAPFKILQELKESLGLQFRVSSEEIALNLSKQKVAGRRLGIFRSFRHNPAELDEETAKYIYYTYFKRDIEEAEALLSTSFTSWKFAEKALDGSYIARF